MKNFLYFLMFWAGCGVFVPCYSQSLPAGPAGTAAEQWAWERLQAGEEADFATREGCHSGSFLEEEERSAEEDACRTLSAEFLRRIAVTESWRQLLGRPQISISGARISGYLDFSYDKLEIAFLVNASRFDEQVSLGSAQVTQDFMIARSLLTGGLSGDQARFEASLFLDGSRSEAAVTLAFVQMEGDLIAQATRFSAGLDLAHSRLGAINFTDGTLVHGEQLNLSFAEIQRDIFISRSPIEGGLLATRAVIKGAVTIQQGSVSRLNFGNAQIERGLLIDGVPIDEDLDLLHSTVGGSVDIRNSRIQGAVILSQAAIGRDLLIFTSTIGQQLFVYSSRIGGSISIVNTEISRFVGMEKITISGSLNFLTSRILGSEISIDISSGLNISDARISGDVTTLGSTIERGISARGMQVGSNIQFNNLIAVSGAVDLFRVQAGGNVLLQGAQIGLGLSMRSAQVSGSVWASQSTRILGGGVDLSITKIGRNVHFHGIQVVGGVDGQLLEVGGALLWGQGAVVSEGPLNLLGARIGSNLDILGGRFEFGMNGNFMTVGGAVTAAAWQPSPDEAPRNTIFGPLQDTTDGSATAWQTSLIGARIEGQLDFRGAYFPRGLIAENLSVRTAVLMDGVLVEGDRVDLLGAQIGGNLQLNRARLRAGLRLFGATIGGALLATEARFEEVAPYLNSIRVQSLVDFDDSVFTEGFTAQEARIGGGVYLRRLRADDGLVDLFSSTIGGNLEVSGARMERGFRAENATVAGSFNALEGLERTRIGVPRTPEDAIDVALNLKGARFGQRIEIARADIVGAYLHFARTEGPLMIRDSHFREGGLQALAARIGGTLELDGVQVDSPSDLSLIVVEGALHLERETRFRGELSLQGARVSGGVFMESSYFPDGLVLSETRIGGNLTMKAVEVGLTSTELPSPAYCLSLRDARIGGNLEFAGPTKLQHGLLADNLEVEGSLRFLPADGGSFQIESTGMLFQSARIGRDIVLSGLNTRGFVHFDRARVGGSILAEAPSTFSGSDNNHFNLFGATVAGDVRIEGHSFHVSFGAGGLQVGRYFVAHGTRFTRPVRLENARIGSTLWVGDSRIEADFEADSIHVEDHVHLRNVQATARIGLTHARVGGNVLLGGARLTEVDLGGAEVTGDLRLAEQDGLASWPEGGGQLNLRQARFGGLHDGNDDQAASTAWPRRIGLSGLSYTRLGGSALPDGAGMADRPDEWYMEWLARSTPYVRQPYEQLARVLRTAGYSLTADAVLRAGRDRERHETSRWGQWSWLTLQRWTIGYGYGFGFLMIIPWVVGLTLTGWVILLRSRTRRKGAVWCLLASFNQVWPIGDLNPDYGRVIFADRPGDRLLTPFETNAMVVLRLFGLILFTIASAGVAAMFLIS